MVYHCDAPACRECGSIMCRPIGQPDAPERCSACNWVDPTAAALADAVATVKAASRAEAFLQAAEVAEREAVGWIGEDGRACARAIVRGIIALAKGTGPATVQRRYERDIHALSPSCSHIDVVPFAWCSGLSAPRIAGDRQTVNCPDCVELISRSRRMGQ